MASGRAPSVVEMAIHVVRGRWFQVFASFLIMVAAGATYLFGVYSKDIKATLGYTQETLNTMAFFKDLGANIGIISGLINEFTPPWVVLAIGAAMNFSGYFMIYLAITGRLTHVKFWHMCAFIYIGANSQSFANTGSVVTCVKNFPESRGILLGLLKGYVGLSGALITQMYYAIYGNDSKSLVLLIAWLPAAISLASLGTIRIVKVVRQPNELKVLYSFLYISMLFAAYLMTVILLQKNLNFSHKWYVVSATLGLVMLILPLSVVAKEEISLLRQRRQSLDAPPSIAIEKPPEEAVAAAETAVPPAPSEASGKNTKGGTRWYSNVFNPPARGEDYTILQAVLSIDMLILFVATFCGLGGDLAALDNMGQIAESLGYPAHTVSSFLSLTSIWNYMGRVFAGFASEILLAKYKFPRTLWLSIVLFLSCIGHLCIGFGIPGALYIASVILGFCFGAQLPLIFAIISELFGLKYYATLFNFGQLASPAGSYVLNVKVAGGLYDREALKQKRAGIVHPVTNAKELVCIGVQCFRLSFIIIAALTFFGGLVSLILVYRTMDFYKSDIYAKFRQESTEAEITGSSNGTTTNQVGTGNRNEKEKSST